MTSSSRLSSLAAGVAAFALAAVTLAPPASAVAYTASTDPAQAAAGWLSTQFVDDSHLPSPDGDHFDSKYGNDYYANYGMNADVIFGLAAAKTGSTAARTALGYLADNIEGYADLSGVQGGPYDGSIAKLAVAASVLGVDPTAFAAGRSTVDLIGLLTDHECPSDGTTCTPGSALNIYSSVSESFVLLAQSRAGSAPSAAATKYFLSLQCDNGGFTDSVTACGDGTADIDSTSYAIMALTAIGGHDSEVASAATWLRDQQNPAGYWIGQDIPNSNSTGLAASALQSTGADVAKARTWLLSQQVAAGRPGAGAIRYDATFTPTTTSATSPSVIATAQALVGLTDSSSLATLSAAGSGDDLAVFAPAMLASDPSVVAGDRSSIRAVGFVAGERVVVELHSTPVRVATVTANPSGVVAASFVVPASLPAGAHSVVLTGASSGLSASRALVVDAAPATGSTTPSVPGTTTASPVVPAAAGTNDPIAATGLAGPRLTGVALAGGAAVLAGLVLLIATRRRAGRHGQL